MRYWTFAALLLAACEQQPMKPAAQSAAVGFDGAQVTDAAARVVQKWKAICEREKWVEKTYVLKPDDSEFVTRIERATLGPLQDKQAQKSKKKK